MSNESDRMKEKKTRKRERENDIERNQQKWNISESVVSETSRKKDRKNKKKWESERGFLCHLAAIGIVGTGGILNTSFLMIINSPPHLAYDNLCERKKSTFTVFTFFSLSFLIFFIICLFVWFCSMSPCFTLTVNATVLFMIKYGWKK